VASQLWRTGKCWFLPSINSSCNLREIPQRGNQIARAFCYMVLDRNILLRLIRVHQEHREEHSRLRLAGIGADTWQSLGFWGSSVRPCERQCHDKQRTEDAFRGTILRLGRCKVRPLPVSGGAIRLNRSDRGGLRPTGRANTPRRDRPSIGPRGHAPPRANRQAPSDSGRQIR
jgi:hypothetical protein